MAAGRVCNVIEPIFEKTFITDSYANRTGKGTHRALDRCQHFARRYPYVLQCDLQQFFPSIDHEILRTVIARHIHDPDVMQLTDLIMESGKDVLRNVYEPMFFPGDDMFALCRARGLPIGNLTSQFWANVCLNPFDHFVKRELRCNGYLRYVDDFLLFANDKRTLWDYARRIEDRLTKFRLSMHPPCVRPVGEGIPFLGFVVFPEKRLLKRRKVVHFKRRFKLLISEYESGGISGDQFTSCVQAWNNHARFGNTCAIREKILSDRFFMAKIHQRRNYVVLKRKTPSAFVRVHPPSV